VFTTATSRAGCVLAKGLSDFSEISEIRFCPGFAGFFRGHQALLINSGIPGNWLRIIERTRHDKGPAASMMRQRFMGCACDGGDRSCLRSRSGSFGAVGSAR